jgi:hypothetical protein
MRRNYRRTVKAVKAVKAVKRLKAKQRMQRTQRLKAKKQKQRKQCGGNGVPADILPGSTLFRTTGEDPYEVSSLMTVEDARKPDL